MTGERAGLVGDGTIAAGEMAMGMSSTTGDLVAIATGEVAAVGDAAAIAIGKAAVAGDA